FNAADTEKILARVFGCLFENLFWESSSPVHASTHVVLAEIGERVLLTKEKSVFDAELSGSPRIHALASVSPIAVDGFGGSTSDPFLRLAFDVDLNGTTNVSGVASSVTCTVTSLLCIVGK